MQSNDPTGWFCVHQIGKVDPSELPPHPLMSMGLMPMPTEPVFANVAQFDLCSQTCLVAFAQNGFKSAFPADFTEGTVPDVPAE